MIYLIKISVYEGYIFFETVDCDGVESLNLSNYSDKFGRPLIGEIEGFSIRHKELL